MHSFTTPLHLIRPSERYSESQPIRSRIWLCFLPCQFQVKLTGTFGWLFRDLVNTCPRIPVCWFLRQHIFWRARWDPTISSWIFQRRCSSKLWNKQWSTGLTAWRARQTIQSKVWMLVKLFISLIIIPQSRWFFSIKHRLRHAVINIMHRLRSEWLVSKSTWDLAINSRNTRLIQQLGPNHRRRSSIMNKHRFLSR